MNRRLVVAGPIAHPLFIGLAFVAIMTACFVAGRCTGPRPEPPLPPLPADVVPVTVVKEIPVEVPGPERVVERVVWRTKEVTVEVPVVQEILRTIREDPDLDTLDARVGVDAQKVEGLADGLVTAGWRGRIFCDLRVGDTWHRLATEPLDLQTSIAEATRPAGTVEEQTARWRTEARAMLTSAPGLRLGTSWYGRSRVGWAVDLDYDLGGGPEDTWRVAGGAALTLGRR